MNPGMNLKPIDSQDPTCLMNLQSESILLSSLQSYLSFNFSHFSSKKFTIVKFMKNAYFALKNEIFWHLEKHQNPRLPQRCIWDHRCVSSVNPWRLFVRNSLQNSTGLRAFFFFCQIKSAKSKNLPNLRWGSTETSDHRYVPLL